MRRLLYSLLLAYLCASAAVGQTALVTRNVNLRIDRSTSQNPVTELTPGTVLQLLEPDSVGGYYHVQTQNKQTGFVWAKNVQIQDENAAASISNAGTGSPASSSSEPGPPLPGAPLPLLAKGHPVDWWFVFKFNSAAFPGCGGTATRTCLFGGTVQKYKAFSQQFVYASSEVRTLQRGGGCVGDTTVDPVGATFEELYDNSFHYLIWNDQFYDDPQIQGCGKACSAPWGHSKGMLVWSDSGDGFVLQVTTPSWPAAGSKQSPRKTDGNTLGCVKDNDVEVSQHFFALKLTKDDVVKVLMALQNASVVTDPTNLQLARNGGPVDIQNLVKGLGTKSQSQTYTKDVLSTGVELISKPSHLHVPPWQMVSAVLDGISLRTATWWANPNKIDTTTSTTQIACWDPSLAQPGAVEIATSGHWADKEFGLTGGPGPDFNHAELGVSISGAARYSIFGDMNQQGSVSEPKCSSSQNERGGLFYVVNDSELHDDLTNLVTGDTAPTK